MLQSVFKTYYGSFHNCEIIAYCCKCLKMSLSSANTIPKIKDLSLRLSISGFIISLYKNSNRINMGTDILN